MDVSTIIGIVTIVVTFICGFIAKKLPWFNNKLIPIQNLAIGLISGTIYFFMTKDINLVIISIGLGAGGAYDLVKNIKTILKKNKWTIITIFIKRST